MLECFLEKLPQILTFFNERLVWLMWEKRWKVEEGVGREEGKGSSRTSAQKGSNQRATTLKGCGDRYFRNQLTRPQKEIGSVVFRKPVRGSMDADKVKACGIVAVDVLTHNTKGTRCVIGRQSKTTT